MFVLLIINPIGNKKCPNYAKTFINIDSAESSCMLETSSHDNAEDRL